MTRKTLEGDPPPPCPGRTSTYDSGGQGEVVVIFWRIKKTCAAPLSRLSTPLMTQEDHRLQQGPPMTQEVHRLQQGQSHEKISHEA